MFASRAEFFSLEIKVEGFCTTDFVGRKSYSKGKVIKCNVEIGTFTFELLMNSLRNEVKWALNQDATVWFFDKRIGEDVRLTNEIQMLDLYEMYKSEMSCHILVSVFAKTVCDDHEFDALEPLCVLGPDEDIDRGQKLWKSMSVLMTNISICLLTMHNQVHMLLTMLLLMIELLILLLI